MQIIGEVIKRKKIGYKPLPFYCCCLSLQPFTQPYGTRDGFIFDVAEIFEWIKEYGTHPLTGKKMSVDDLIKLRFHKNPNGQFSCPVMGSVFTDNSYIVAIATTGNVFSHEAVKN
eukprot:UN32966